MKSPHAAKAETEVRTWKDWDIPVTWINIICLMTSEQTLEESVRKWTFLIFKMKVSLFKTCLIPQCVILNLFIRIGSLKTYLKSFWSVLCLRFFLVLLLKAMEKVGMRLKTHCFLLTLCAKNYLQNPGDVAIVNIAWK